MDTMNDIQTNQFKVAGMPHQLQKLLDELTLTYKMKEPLVESVRVALIRAWEIGQDSIIEDLKNQDLPGEEN